MVAELSNKYSKSEGLCSGRISMKTIYNRVSKDNN
jgi:hypothetical protein